MELRPAGHQRIIDKKNAIRLSNRNQVSFFCRFVLAVKGKRIPLK